MALLPEASVDHINEAIRLFKVSTLNAATAGMSGEGMMSAEMVQEVQTVEDMLKRRLAIGSSVPVGKIVEQLVQQGRRVHVVRQAVDALVKKGEMKTTNQRRMLTRVR